jgi:hypothetical protein
MALMERLHLTILRPELSRAVFAQPGGNLDCGLIIGRLKLSESIHSAAEGLPREKGVTQHLACSIVLRPRLSAIR